MKRLLLIALVATAANGQVVATAGRNIVVAHDDRIEMFDASANKIWSGDGVGHPAAIAVSSDRLAVVDSFANAVAIADLATGRSRRVATGETPVAALFLGRDLYVLDRDANRLEKIGGASIDLAPDPSFMRAANGRIYVYSRLDGIVQEIAPEAMRVVRRLTVVPFASDLEIDGTTGYLVCPQDAKLRTFSLRTMQRGGDLAAGAVPVDLALAHSTALSGSRLAVADPSAKRVWIVEGNQSIGAAFARGFIRGLLGLGLFEPKSSEFPTGVDRVQSRGSAIVAYDSASRTLYRVLRSKAEPVARDVAPDAFALSDSGIAVWQNGALRLIR